MGIFDSLFGQGFLGLQPPVQAQPMPQPMQQPVPQPGILGGFDRLSGAFGGLINGGSPVGGVLNAIKTLSTGVPTDPNDIAQQKAIGLYNSLQKDFGMSEPQARLAVNNPAVMKELAKAMTAPTVSNIGNTALRVGPFGQVTPVFREPQKPELVEQYDPQTGRTVKKYVQPPEPFGGYGIPGNMVRPGETPGSTPTTGGFYSAPSAMEKSEQTKTGDLLAETYKKYIDQSVGATKKLGTLSRMAQLTDKAYEGAGAPALQMLRSSLATLGFDPGKVPAGEEFNALSNKLVLDALNGSLGAGVSNADVSFISNTVPHLAQTKEGRKQLIDVSAELAKREQTVAKMATEWKREKGTIEGFDAHLAEWSDKNPMFKGPSFSERFNGQQQATHAAEPTATGPNGQKITLRNGQWVPLK